MDSGQLTTIAGIAQPPGRERHEFGGGEAVGVCVRDCVAVGVLVGEEDWDGVTLAVEEGVEVEVALYVADEVGLGDDDAADITLILLFAESAT